MTAERARGRRVRGHHRGLLPRGAGLPALRGVPGQAVVADPGIYDRAAADWTGFWAEQAGALDWFRPWDTVLEWDLPFARWFVGGTLNVSYNCLDRHVAAGRGDRVAFHWEGEPGDTRTITYAELLADVVRFANVLRGPRGAAGVTGWPSTCR